MTRITVWSTIAAAAALSLPQSAAAQVGEIMVDHFSRGSVDLWNWYLGTPGLRTYWGYPYYHSYGPRYDPYWSYKSSYFPETYGGDGSYYGLGYSGYAGNGWYGSYWYW